MTTTTRFIYTGLGFLMLTLAAGCGRDASPAPAPVPQETQAIAAAGDLAPRALFKLDAPAGMVVEKAMESSPSSPKNLVKYVAKPETVRFKETTLYIPAGAAAGEVSLPVDAAEGTEIYLGSGAKTDADKEAAAKDSELYAPGGKARLNIRAPRVATQASLDKASDALKANPLGSAGGLATLKFGEDKPLNVVQLDGKATKGDYVLKYGAVAAKNGVMVEVRLPKSNIELDVTPTTSTMLYGDDASVAIELLDGAAGITGATIEAELVSPAGVNVGKLPVRELGNGKYEILASKGLTLSSAPGMYNVFIRAKGTSNGVRFDRLGSTAFGFAVPTARIATVGAPRLVKDDAGRVAAFELDVNLEVASADRYEVSATLVAVDGAAERPLAIAETAAGVGEGKHTFTLRFDAGYAKLSKLEGAFEIRGLQLYSQGRNSLFQRHQKGLGLAFAAVRSAELIALPTIPPAVEQMMEDGEFDLTK